MTVSRALFPVLLGEYWALLASPVRQMHGDSACVVARGGADVDGSTRFFARFMRKILGLPKLGSQQPLEINIERQGSREIWQRRFTRAHMRSMLDRSHNGMHLCERLGPITLRFTLRRDDDAIDWQLLGGRLYGIPLPRAIFGNVLSRSSSSEGRYTFLINTTMPMLGQLIAYRGWLEIVDAC